MASDSPPVELPAGRSVLLPGRGRTFVREAPGPPGAPTILLLHGWTVTADLNWFACYQPLSQFFRVVALDHRGHGKGIRSRRPFRLEDCADDAAALAAELGIERLIAVGYSMGGPVAQLLWRRHRHLVDALVLCATSRSFASPDMSSRLFFSGMLGLSVAARLTPQPMRHRMAQSLIRRRLQGGPLAEWGLSEMRQGNPIAALEAGWAVGRFDSRPWIGEVNVPTAVLITTLDRVVPPDRQRELANAIPDSIALDIEGDHAICATDPDRFVPTLVAACTDVSRRAKPSAPE